MTSLLRDERFDPSLRLLVPGTLGARREIWSVLVNFGGVWDKSFIQGGCSLRYYLGSWQRGPWWRLGLELVMPVGMNAEGRDSQRVIRLGMQCGVMVDPELSSLLRVVWVLDDQLMGKSFCWGLLDDPNFLPHLHPDVLWRLECQLTYLDEGMWLA